MSAMGKGFKLASLKALLQTYKANRSIQASLQNWSVVADLDKEIADIEEKIEELENE